MSDIVLLALGVILTLGTAIFVAAEFSLVALDPATVAGQAETGGFEGWLQHFLVLLLV